MVLIPKVKNPENMSQLRPISLCNVLYKVGSKALANRLKPLLQSFISPSQSAFVPGRHISDNSLVAFEIAHFLKRRREGNQGYGALKLDMSKAYDRVEWDFIEAAMLKLGFHQSWVRWVMRCVRTVSYSFILNGDPRGLIWPSRGLRQGDAISPYLFLICAEVLSRLISNAEAQGQLHGLKICRNAPSISHLFFADDSLVFFKATGGDCEVLKDIFTRYELASGQKINFDKSSVSFSHNVPMELQESLARVLNVTRVDKHDKYLGLPMEISYSKVEAFSFIKEKVQKKLSGWKEKYLSAAGKEVLLKAVVQSIPTYVMGCFELPLQLCHDIHQLMAKFWWGSKGSERRIHWVAWDKLCAPKNEGGMGFKNLHVFNLSLLAKQGWRLLSNPDSIAAQIFKARYFPKSGFMDAMAVPDMSYTWRSILAGRELLSLGLRFQIGNGNNVSLWNDPWLPLPYSFKPYSIPMEGTESWKVGDLIDQERHTWLEPVIFDLFPTAEAEIILKIPLSRRSSADRMIWHFDNKGLYNVKSGYRIARIRENLGEHASTSSDRCGNETSLWHKIWKACIPPKVRVFIWRLIKGCIPTRAALGKKKINLQDVRCVFCNKHLEDDTHIFKQCKSMRSFWNSSAASVNPHDHPSLTLTEWISWVTESQPPEQIALFFMNLWTIWGERNKIIWEGGSFNPTFMASRSSELLHEYQKYHPLKLKTKTRPVSKWEFPPRGRLKMNIDGSFRADMEVGGIGIVIRDDRGRCKAALQRSISHVSSAIHVEAEACRTGLIAAIHHGWKELTLETDCAALATALLNSAEDLSDIGCIVGDCKEYMRAFTSLNIRHIYREANCVANRLAYVASFNTIDEFWLNDTPSIIEDVIQEDLFSLSRGIGITPPSM